MSDIMLPSISNSAASLSYVDCPLVPASPCPNPEYAVLLVAYVAFEPLNLTTSLAATVIVTGVAADVIEVHVPSFKLYSIVFVSEPLARQ